MIGPRHRVESEDIPEGVNTALVGVEHMTELSLEPTAAPRTAYALLRRTAKALASSAHGVVLDLQTDTTATPTGVRSRAVIAVVGFAYLPAEAYAQCVIVDKPEELFARSDSRHAAGAAGPAAICWDSGRAGTSSRWVPRDVSLTPWTFLAP